MTAAACTEAGCPAVVPNQPGNHCGGQPDGSPQGCGRLFCDNHLYATYRDGYLCGVDYDNLNDRVPEEDDAAAVSRGWPLPAGDTR